MSGVMGERHAAQIHHEAEIDAARQAVIDAAKAWRAAYIDMDAKEDAVIDVNDVLLDAVEALEKMERGP